MTKKATIDLNPKKYLEDRAFEIVNGASKREDSNDFYSKLNLY